MIYIKLFPEQNQNSAGSAQDEHRHSTDTAPFPFATTILVPCEPAERTIMPNVKLSPAIMEISGKVGNMVFRRTASGKIIITKRPDMSNVKWSEAQIAQRERFKEASLYAKAAMADPKVRAVFDKLAKNNKKRPYDMAVSDYFQGNNLLEEKK